MKETQKRLMCRQCCPEAFAAPYGPSHALRGFPHLYLYLCPLQQRHYKVGTVANQACTAHCAKHGTLHGDFE